METRRWLLPPGMRHWQNRVATGVATGDISVHVKPAGLGDGGGVLGEVERSLGGD